MFSLLDALISPKIDYLLIEGLACLPKCKHIRQDRWKKMYPILQNTEIEY